MTITQSRRAFLGSGAALMIGMTLPLRSRAQQGPAAALDQGAGAAMPDAFAPNAFIRIGTDDTVTLLSKHIEFGQGPYTGLATLVAEELDADWSQMRAEGAPANNELYKNLFFGLQGTGGSTAIANSYMQMRKAGAAAKAMLVAAAAEEWGVPAGEITVSKGVVSHPSGKSSGFGALTEKAAGMTAPDEPVLKDPKDFVLIGTDLPKLDTKAKSTGEAQFTLDVYRDNMKTVVVAHPRVMGATVKSFDSAEAEAVPGVTAVREIPMGVAVYAESTAAALKGRSKLKIEWDLSKAETRSSDEIMADFSASAKEGGVVVEEAGDSDAAIEGAATVHEAEFRFPYLAHAPMEPLDAVLELKDGKAEVWAGAQFPGADQQAIAQTLGLKPEDVTLHVLYAGGSFGRRAQTIPQMGMEISAIAKAAGGDGAWKLVWTREDDLAGGFYRPMTVHRMRGGLDADGNIVGWQDTVVNQSIMLGTMMEGPDANGKDATSYEGSTKMPYDLPALKVDWVRKENPVSVLWWRSVGHTHTGYATEVFLDELLEKAGKDPVQGRLDLMKPEASRDRGVLEAVAKLAGWDGQKVKNGRGYGVAVHESFSTYVAQIVEVSEVDGKPKVHKVWCAVDCGVAVNPNVIRAQMEGGIGYGLGTILHNALILGKGGEVTQLNFDDYPMLRINEMPEVEVEIIKSAEAPTGVGEPGLPPVGPALANAWRALTGTSVTSLPFGQAGV
ncbi:xanthine dehydrogenase family protein molybdopterin-binding subunit [Oceaniglobus roseus]|uniref:xanthine dehydrogenase family protein molybdopterin-binding subunit n=1 Tax=Oceaniglobus roseus TaxID=1737570 RepID=UPI000C7F34FB|nr:xanthine dehydrogenase family protein molybdopterin-binding subunit [Kandeliimicrobium roseum]